MPIKLQWWKNLNLGDRNIMSLLTGNFTLIGVSKNLHDKCTGLNTVRKIINQTDYKVDLLKTMQNYMVCHVLQLNHDRPRVIGQPFSETIAVQLMIRWNEKLHRYFTLTSGTRCCRTGLCGAGSGPCAPAVSRLKASSMHRKYWTNSPKIT